HVDFLFFNVFDGAFWRFALVDHQTQFLRAAVQNTLGTVDNKGTVVGHERNFRPCRLLVL
ncbi:hypothetical protein, partial [Enterococcus faecium]|uniref:hypothetical protein n=1 Tax=Enterococcus faecium TaxID=1352 RepID=UPI001C53CAED